MIGFDRKTGRTIRGWDQFLSRITQVMTTQVADREKRRGFGSRVPETLSRNMSEALLMKAQVYALEAVYVPVNGLSDFSPTRCVASRGEAGVILRFWGDWNGRSVEFEVAL